MANTGFSRRQESDAIRLYSLASEINLAVMPECDQMLFFSKAIELFLLYSAATLSKLCLLGSLEAVQVKHRIAIEKSGHT